MSDDSGSAATAPGASIDFIRAIVDEDLASGRHHGRVATRFPPEPNGYLHIGHAKSICLNFGIAQERGGICNLRFDDTNPTKEDVEYVDAIREDVAWLGFAWSAELYASDYFEQLYQFAVELIKQGKAYVDSLSADQVRAYRGTLTEPGKNSPHRDRSVIENLDLFARMRAGEFPDGAHVLRAKIDMASPNINLRDPTLYRIRHASHHRTGEHRQSGRGLSRARAATRYLLDRVPPDPRGRSDLCENWPMPPAHRLAPLARSRSCHGQPRDRAATGYWLALARVMPR
jgi:glutaminyl-tRNA synthetase